MHSAWRHLTFPSLIRTFDYSSKVLTLGNTQKHLVFLSLIRTFAPDMEEEGKVVREGDGTGAYSHERAGELYADLLHAASLLPDTAAYYRRMGTLYSHILSENTSMGRVTMVGAFAKTDYLLHEGHADRKLTRSVNDMRVRLSEPDKTAGEHLADEETCLEDLKAMAMFISLIYHAPIPASVRLRFPAEARRRRKGRAMGDCIRMIVKGWDERYVTGITENDGAKEVRLCYVPEEATKSNNWSHLQPLLSEGTQLNLVHPVMRDGLVYADLIIYEPDYLVDISQVAACMEDYGDSPLVYLLHQLEPAPQTEAILLGNLASQMLDEEGDAYRRGDKALHSYQETVTEFFRRNPLSVLTTPLSREFHAKAMAQQRHIRVAIREDLPRTVSTFDPKKVMVEPSFFSQMLGLQGRMDFLQLDHRLVIEQKSGNGEFVPGDPEKDVPKIRRTHYAQLLLYMAVLRYNYREQYERNNREMQAFLLYSKYPNPLQGLGAAPELLMHSIRLRNQLVWHQLQLAEGGYDILGRITPQTLNKNNSQSLLWKQYKLPQIAALLDSVRNATPLEQAYYFRMLAFVSKEHVLAKLGNKTKENSGFASIWLDSLQDKLAAGNIFCNLQLASPTQGEEGRVDSVTLSFGEDADRETSNFRPGDIVILYSYPEDSVPDATRSMVFRCSVMAIASDTITLSLRKSQIDAYVFLRHADRPWAVEHDFYESSSTMLIKGIHSFLSAPEERKSLFLAQRHPYVDTTLEPLGEYGDFNTLARRALQARELFLVIGPPGTGKTSFGMLYTLEEELRHRSANVLVLAYTNRAVDEICGKLEDRVDYIRIGNALACPSKYKPHLLEERVKTLRGKDELEAMVMSARVFVGTVTAMNGSLALFRKKQFSLAIIDEASQILEPHLIALFSAMHGDMPAIGRFVMIGDHKQLPAVVGQREDESVVNDPLLREIGLTDCRLSLFERLLSRYSEDPTVTYMLHRQGRMHRDIADFPDRMFYGGKLDVVPLPHQVAMLPQQVAHAGRLARLVLTRRVVFLPSPMPKDSPSDKVNLEEAGMIADLACAIYEAEGEGFDPRDTMGVIVPYRNQIAAVRLAIARKGIPLLGDISVDTVERYQGSQRKYIIYGFTVQRRYQLKFLTSGSFVEDGALIDRRLNVAMTRAQEHLIMIGNPEVLCAHPLYRQLYTTFAGSPDRKA